MFKPEGVITPVLTTLNKDEMFDAGAYKQKQPLVF